MVTIMKTQTKGKRDTFHEEDIVTLSPKKLSLTELFHFMLLLVRQEAAPSIRPKEKVSSCPKFNVEKAKDKFPRPAEAEQGRCAAQKK